MKVRRFRVLKDHWVLKAGTILEGHMNVWEGVEQLIAANAEWSLTGNPLLGHVLEEIGPAVQSVKAKLYGDHPDPRCFGCNDPIAEPYRITTADLTGNPNVDTGLAVFCAICLPDEDAQ